MPKRRAGKPPVQADWEEILPTKVFISYTQESASHNKRVLSLANDLRDLGFDCDLDQYHVNENWPVWMERSIEQAKHVLVVCTPVYRRRWDNQERPGVGLGAQWESLLTRQHLYMSPNKNDKFIPVVFRREHVSTIPTALAGWTRIDLWRTTGLRNLRCRLLNIPPAVKPPLATSLAPIQVAEGFFTGQQSLPTNRPIARPVEAFDHSTYGLVDQSEVLFPNLFAISYPQVIRNAKITLKRGIKLGDRLQRIWEELGNAGKLPIDFWIEAGIVYRFKPFNEPVWQTAIRRQMLQPLLDKPSMDWAGSSHLEDKKHFIKLLNRSLDGLCADLGTAHDLVWPNEMRCHLFVPRRGVREGTIKVKAISQVAERTVFNAIPDKTSSKPDAIQHWKHQAFRHSFVRYGSQWYLNLIPFWAFTSDGKGSPSRWQKTSSSNMRRPEKNRAVLGHIMFWASILCQDPDFFRAVESLQIHRPAQLMADPAIDDKAWIKIAKADDKAALSGDLALEL